MQTIFSGIRPTGGLHIGNYVGALSQWVELQNQPDTQCFFMIADYHALLSFREMPLDVGTLDTLAWILASGVNAQKSAIFLQSAIPAHTEMAWIFNALIGVPELSRMTQYKDLVRQGSEKPTAALLTYPLLQAADILLYHCNIVPVGQDQVQHAELARDVARTFNTATNSRYFEEPIPRIGYKSRVLSLHDPTRKMAKSLPQGAILLADEPDVTRHKIMRAVTDSAETGKRAETDLANLALKDSERVRLYQTMTPGLRNLFLLLEATSNQDTADQFLRKYAHKTLLYKELKEALAESVAQFLAPVQSSYRDIRADEAKLKQVLAAGTMRAKTVADQTLKGAKDLIKILEL